MKKEKIICDVCKKEIRDGREKSYGMIVIDVHYNRPYNDGGSVAAYDSETETYHIHFKCGRKVFKTSNPSSGVLPIPDGL